MGFLNFIAEQAKRYAGFHLQMKTEAVELLEEQGRVMGVRATTEEGEVEVRAELVIGADGRHSRMRERANLKVEDLGAPDRCVVDADFTE